MVDLNITQHFRPEETPFLESVEDMCGQAQNEYRPILTDFMNPRELYMFEAVANRFDSISYQFFGGVKSAEMKRGLIYPDYFEPKESDFQIVAYLIDYPKKFATLSHGQILGSIMGSGINRNVVGDIVTDGDDWQFVCEREMSDYLTSQLDKVGKIKVKIKPLELANLITPVDESEETTTTVASLRIDALISEGFNISRHHAKELVEQKLVKLNWAVNERPDTEIRVLDVISVRGFGRLSIKQIDGLTKKGKIRVSLDLLKRGKK
ncbi:YlmH/Sll1252 family protein [Lentilactobacillus sp. Marseille-Q4993]|uniref:YlmH family RNA-binding protein n=1 Tax=Lentilactobacillus sp. Marseille-Q4993 TaxID=3039492 RepID=UPI0024BC7A70|nr:YlmH/Sll1252 family protein [Lentilactobacillus sp. Marseille-Q4993]